MVGLSSVGEVGNWWIDDDGSCALLLWQLVFGAALRSLTKSPFEAVGRGGWMGGGNRE